MEDVNVNFEVFFRFVIFVEVEFEFDDWVLKKKLKKDKKNVEKFVCVVVFFVGFVVVGGVLFGFDY